MTMDGTIVELLTAFQLPAIFIGTLLFGETVIITAAFLSTQELWPLMTVFWVSLTGTLTADSIWFLFGRKLIRFFNRLEKHRARSERLLASVEEITGNNRLALILCVKFIYGTRIFTIMYLSMQGMHYARFIIYDALASTLWLSLVCTVGWLAGKSITNLAPFLNTFEYATLVLLLFLVAYKMGSAWISKRISKK